MNTNIFGFTIYNKSKQQFMKDLEKYDKVHIISGNPQILEKGLEVPELFSNFTSENSVIIPDGIGTVVCSKIIGSPVTEKIAGIEVMEEILKFSQEQEKSVYLLGAKNEILKACIENLKKKYPKLKVVGSHDGYFDLEECDSILEEIKQREPYAIFLAMGCPKQEMFVIKYMNELPCNIFMGVGGSFDIFAGKLKRAPKWMIKLGLEWLYRVAKEPTRVKRLIPIPRFIIKVFLNTYFKKK